MLIPVKKSENKWKKCSTLSRRALDTDQVLICITQRQYTQQKPQSRIYFFITFNVCSKVSQCSTSLCANVIFYATMQWGQWQEGRRFLQNEQITKVEQIIGPTLTPWNWLFRRGFWLNYCSSRTMSLTLSMRCLVKQQFNLTSQSIYLFIYQIKHQLPFHKLLWSPSTQQNHQC